MIKLDEISMTSYFERDTEDRCQLCIIIIIIIEKEGIFGQNCMSHKIQFSS